MMPGDFIETQEREWGHNSLVRSLANDQRSAEHQNQNQQHTATHRQNEPPPQRPPPQQPVDSGVHGRALKAHDQESYASGTAGTARPRASHGLNGADGLTIGDRHDPAGFNFPKNSKWALGRINRFQGAVTAADKVAVELLLPPLASPPRHERQSLSYMYAHRSSVGGVYHQQRRYVRSTEHESTRGGGGGGGGGLRRRLLQLPVTKANSKIIDPAINAGTRADPLNMQNAPYKDPRVTHNSETDNERNLVRLAEMTICVNQASESLAQALFIAAAGSADTIVECTPERPNRAFDEVADPPLSDAVKASTQSFAGTHVDPPM